MQKEWGRRSASTQQRFPGNLEALYSLEIVDPAMKAMADQADDLNARPPYFGLFNQVLNQARGKVMNGEVTAEEALSAAENEVSSAMERDGFRNVWTASN